MAKGKADPGHRKGVAPGSFIDLLVTAADRTTGRAFTDGEIAAQVRLHAQPWLCTSAQRSIAVLPIAQSNGTWSTKNRL